MNDLDLLVEMFAKAGKPVVENKQPPTITYQPIVLDLNWMNDYNEATAPESRKRLMKAVGNMGVGNILQLGQFINSMNDLLKRPIDIQNHVETIAKVDVLRTLHNLIATKKGASGKGFQFEIFIADVFGGKVKTSTATNIADVEFEGSGTQVSLKFIAKGSKVSGSYENLLRALGPDLSGEIIYIIGEKDERSIHFYQFVMNRDVIARFESMMAKRIKSRLVKGRKNVEGATGGTFVLKKEEEIKANKDVYQYKKLGTLSMKGAVAKTQEMFQALDAKFQNIFSTLQELNEAAQRFKTDAKATKDAEATKATAKATADKADATKAAAEKI
jgi:hypothetical protein